MKTNYIALLGEIGAVGFILTTVLSIVYHAETYSDLPFFGKIGTLLVCGCMLGIVYFMWIRGIIIPKIKKFFKKKN